MNISTESLKNIISYIGPYNYLHSIINKEILNTYQNKKFDIPFLENMFQLFGDSFETYIEKVEDTLEWARYKWVETDTNYKLGSIAEKLELELTQAHRALPDTIITAKIWIEFMKSLRGEGSVEKEEVNHRKGFKF